jgi:hypothetical protein
MVEIDSKLEANNDHKSSESDIRKPGDSRGDFSNTSRPIEEILQERQTTHGDFATNARISQKLKSVAYGEMEGESLSDVHAECLDMIFLKISRIASGQSDFAGHWEDIEGYAKLGRRACRR